MSFLKEQGEKDDSANFNVSSDWAVSAGEG
jgi:hypothetical protein